MKKTNPRNRPATHADVDRAWKRGVDDGVRISSAIFLTVMVDKWNQAENIKEIWQDILKLSEEVKEKRVSVQDMEKVLEDEYGIV